ncbi:iron-containing alcohol dehydrogenase [Oharaeibacter diazotrophicus]|uniref:Glycerol-1-phosphate dehydrogenase [NAD(P)+] n=1 Tax=Oharaeibacter diazotrophicus TaxID=1920512 RepID=A0A4R6RFE7_9HYPH|nr:iron-containing alcohol dehydrogenase [Oharaeibacter diazotrophicus]TDP85023.1 glycerol-1-phosphate dehydrogenase [NAD(P)+] [Oharaeibacter diazotrophicus]BBE73993.1 glycerol-1-phosphate dehydrogenase [NAD(P)+] [Pleomorphomonas sp. SM30]GLS76319.1 3-dehydroquinate synthase [Oharaeibacter diazotrophicus]
MDDLRTASVPLAGSPWTRLIDDVSAGRWISPDTGRPARVPFETVVIADSLSGREADLVRAVAPATRYAVVSDENTREVAGRAVAAALGGAADEIVLDHPHADEETVRRLREATRHAEVLVAVGSGTVNDLCKYATAGDGRSYCVFGTAPSMNGYTSTTASITLDSGLKTTQPAHAARGVFLDLSVNAAAPGYLVAAGLGDSLCRSTAQVDWLFSHRLLGTAYFTAPYVLQADDEAAVLARSAALATGDREAVGYLHRWLALTGFGISVAGMSHPGSMGEHQISHWIDSFAGERHPGTVHGQQVGVTSVTMARLQARILASETAPRIGPIRVDEDGIRRRYPAAAVDDCLKAAGRKALDAEAAAAFNDRLAALWPSLRAELLAVAVPADEIAAHIRAAGGGATAAEIGMDRDLYREAVRHSAEMRDRFSMLDLAAGMGILDDFIAECC